MRQAYLFLNYQLNVFQSNQHRYLKYLFEHEKCLDLEVAIDRVFNLYTNAIHWKFVPLAYPHDIQINSTEDDLTSTKKSRTATLQECVSLLQEVLTMYQCPAHINQDTWKHDIQPGILQTFLLDFVDVVAVSSFVNNSDVEYDQRKVTLNQLRRWIISTLSRLINDNT